MESRDLLRVTDAGLWCEAGDFFIDPWKPVDRAIITHAHSDHARPGSHSYLTSREGLTILRHRLPATRVEAAEWGESRQLNGVRVSLHPAGHMRGSAQIRVEHRGEVWVASGDYKRQPDRTCAPFEPVCCNTFITEATFALPIYRWAPTSITLGSMKEWIAECHAKDGCAVILTYSLGKAQRVLAELGDNGLDEIYVHGAVEPINALYRDAGVRLPRTALVRDAKRGERLKRVVAIAPPSAVAPGWMTHFHDPQTAFVSGWMRIRGTRRRQALDRGFAMSDHVDWQGLLDTIAETRATRVLATHGDSAALVRVLESKGIEAAALPTAYAGEADNSSEDV